MATADLPPFASKEAGGTTLQGLDAFLQILRRNEVRRFSGVLDADPVEVEFGIAALPMKQPVSEVETKGIHAEEWKLSEVGAGTCVCSHDMLEHNETGACLRGCPLATCAKGEVTPAQE